MKATLEKLWSEYLADKCSTIDTDEEKELAKIAANLHDKLNPSLTADQRLDVEKLMKLLLKVKKFQILEFLNHSEFYKKNYKHYQLMLT